MRVAVVTLFPAMFEAIGEYGISSRAIAQGLLKLDTVNPRSFADNPTGRVDDRPYGGGPGMVMAVPPLRKALAQARETAQPVGEGATGRPLTVYLSPQGEPLTQQRVQMLAGLESLVLLCGRYEGVDERLLERDIDLELSLGDYVISGGELAAMVLLDAVIRLQPGALGDEDSAGQDSFAGKGLLDCPHYTRPVEVDGQVVPEVLLSGDHAAIAKWRFEQSLLRTMQRRPDLLEALEGKLDAGEMELLQALRRNASE